MKQVLISPYAQNLRNGKINPKNFPYWKELVELMNNAGIKIIQIGSNKDSAVEGITDFRQNLSLVQIRDLVKECDTWISVDSFLQHLCAYYKLKRGIVIYSKSDPKIFGYTRNINMLKDIKYLREHQMWLWEQEEYDSNAFVSAQEVLDTLLKLLDGK
jgi:ADP-heptose:LPS heptosyltransferase